MPDTPPLRLLPEWAPQSGVLLTWPHRHSDWAGELAAIEAEYTALVAAIAARELALIGCHDEALAQEVRRRLVHAGIEPTRFHLYPIPSDDTWVRDYGPLTVQRHGNLQLVAFTFNAWGGKYPHAEDAQAGARLHAAGAFGALPLQRETLVAEGGAIETDGVGTLLTTAGCLDTATRNPGLDRSEIEARLGATLGIRRTHWLEVAPLPGDDTDGHIDTLARFCDPDTIAHVAAVAGDTATYRQLEGMERQLRELRTPGGAAYRLLPLPQPSPLHAREDGRRLPATYANFLLVNGAVLCPLYGDPADAQALAVMREAFPGRAVIGLPSRALIGQNGSLHCATMQLPAGVVPELEPDPARAAG